MTSSAERSQFMADQIEARRNALGLSPGELVESVGKSDQAVLNMRLGLIRKYSDELKREMCRALEWKPGSIDNVMAGRQPSPLRPTNQPKPQQRPTGGPATRLSDLEATIRRLDDALAQVGTNVAGLLALTARVEALEAWRSEQGGSRDASAGA